MKKHGIIWWLLIGWWWVPFTWPFRIIAALRKAVQNKPTTANQKPTVGQKEETHKVAGVSYRQDAIKALGVKNPNFDKTKRALQAEGLTDKPIYEYTFTPKKVELIPEPDNPYSENGNAVKVVVDGQHIGYIKSGSSAHVHKLIDADRIQQVDCYISGGRSKTLSRYSEDDDYELETEEIGFYARLTITTKPE